MRGPFKNRVDANEYLTNRSSVAKNIKNSPSSLSSRSHVLPLSLFLSRDFSIALLTNAVCPRLESVFVVGYTRTSDNKLIVRLIPAPFFPLALAAEFIWTILSSGLFVKLFSCLFIAR